MAKIVVGLYDDPSTAQAVVAELDDQGYADDSDVVSYDAEGNAYGSNRDVEAVLTRNGVPQDEAHFYAEGVRRGGGLAIIRVEDENAQEVARIMSMHNPVLMEDRMEHWRSQGYTGYDPYATPYGAEEVERERERLQIVEEEVKIGKREVETGGVRVHTYVEEVPVEEQVRLREEHVDVEFREVDQPVADADAVFEEKTIEMRERAEELVVEKEARVTGEVVVSKEAEEHVETVRETERHMRVDVDEIEGKRRAAGVDYGDYDADFRKHYKTTYASSGYDYDVFEPGYRYGHMYGTDERYRDRDFEAVEPEMRRDYDRDHKGGLWGEIKDAARYAYNRVRAAF